MVVREKKKKVELDEVVIQGVAMDRLQTSAHVLPPYPKGFHMNPNSCWWLPRAPKMASGEFCRWAFAETLAFGSLF